MFDPELHFVSENYENLHSIQQIRELVGFYSRLGDPLPHSAPSQLQTHKIAMLTQTDTPDKVNRAQ